MLEGNAVSGALRPHRPKAGDTYQGVYYFVLPFRPAWIYPLGTRLKTKHGMFEVHQDANWGERSVEWVRVEGPNE
jgi:hypothetical protein